MKDSFEVIKFCSVKVRYALHALHACTLYAPPGWNFARCQASQQTMVCAAPF